MPFIDGTSATSLHYATTYTSNGMHFSIVHYSVLLSHCIIGNITSIVTKSINNHFIEFASLSNQHKPQSRTSCWSKRNNNVTVSNRSTISSFLSTTIYGKESIYTSIMPNRLAYLHNKPCCIFKDYEMLPNRTDIVILMPKVVAN